MMNLKNQLENVNMNTTKKLINPDDRRLKQKLTPKQMTFVYEYVHKVLLGECSAAEAARKAGYSMNRARQTATDLMNPHLNPFVVEAVNEMKQDLHQIYGVSTASHLASLKQIREEAREHKHYSAAVAAEVNRGKVAGFYDNKVQTDTPLENMSKEELIKVLENYDKNGITHDTKLIIDDDKKVMTGN